MKMRLSGKTLIYFHVLFSSIIKTIIDIVPAFSILSLVPDIIIIAILGFATRRIRKVAQNKYIKGIIIFIVCLLVYDITEAIAYGTNILLFLWALRNTYRFFLFFVECIVLLDIKDVKDIYNLFEKILIINMVFVPTEYVLGYRGDLLGGTFGITIGCNGPVNIFLVIMSSHYIARWLNREINNKRMFILVGFCLLWAVLAELKFFFIEFVIVLLVEIFRYKNITRRKMRIILVSIICVPLLSLLLVTLFPTQGNILNPAYFLWYLRNVNVGANHFGRYTAIDIVTNVFFRNDLIKIIFGIGAGNAEFSDVALLNSDFYNSYSMYAYNTYQHSMIYVERGVIGLVWNFLFLLFPVLITRDKRFKGNSIAMEVSAESICYIFIMIYNASLRASTSAYFAYFSLSTVFILLAKTNLSIADTSVYKRDNKSEYSKYDAV